MKVLVLGSDGRAHALVWKLFSSPTVDLLVAPGNGGATLLAPQVELEPTAVAEVAQWAFAEGIDLIVPAHSAPLAAGLVDELVSMQIAVWGPSSRATQLERSRCYARTLLEHHQLPLAPGRACADLSTAEKYLATRHLPVIIRADRPEAGEAIYHERYAALEALRSMFSDSALTGPAGGVVIEEFLPGVMISLTAITDGTTAVPLLPVRTYDQLGAAPDSPIAPGMGAITANSAYAGRLGAFLQQRIMQPLVSALAREQLPYWGFLGIDCVVTEQGPRISGLRCSLRDMEAQAVLPRLEDDLLPLIQAALARRLDQLPPLRWRDEVTVAMALVAQGYPHHFAVGGLVEGLGEVDQGVLVFHDQTLNPGGLRHRPVTRGGGLSALLMSGSAAATTSGISVSGGHVLSVVTSGVTLAGARGRALLNAERIRFPGRSYREDIGANEFR